MRFIHNGITYVYGEDLKSADLTQVDFSSTVFRHCNFAGAKLPVAFNTEVAGIRNCTIRKWDSFDKFGPINARIEFSAESDDPRDLMVVNTPVNASGNIIGYKAVLCNCDDKGCFTLSSFIGLVTLLIPEQETRIIYEGGKCRAKYATVLSIEDQQGNQVSFGGRSHYDRKFFYEVGNTVEADSFDDDPLNECSNGIHFFLTRKEAIEYGNDIATALIIYLRAKLED